jgi:hypothetical protein
MFLGMLLLGTCALQVLGYFSVTAYMLNCESQAEEIAK